MELFSSIDVQVVLKAGTQSYTRASVGHRFVFMVAIYAIIQMEKIWIKNEASVGKRGTRYSFCPEISTNALQLMEISFACVHIV